MIRVLIVDDKTASRNLLRRQLEAAHCKVTSARHGAEAVLEAHQELPDVVVSELLMPVMDGFSLLRNWKRAPRLQAVPLIVYTGDSRDARDEQLVRSLGADAFLAKPAAPEVLMARLLEVLQGARGRQLPQMQQLQDGVATGNALKSAEAALQDSQTRLRLATESSGIGLWDWLLGTSEVYFSPMWKRQIGYEDHEIPPRFEEWRNRIHPDDLDRTLQVVSNLLAAPESVGEHELRFRHKDGSYRWMLARTSLIADAQGSPVRMLGSHMDITERKRVETALRDSETKFAAAFRASPTAMAIIALDGRYVEVNEVCCELLGCSRAEVIGRRVSDVGLVSEQEAARLRTEIARAGGSSGHVELRITIPSGDVRYIISSTTTIMLGGVAHRLSTGIDITERKKTEAALRESEQKFAAAFRSSPVALAITSPDKKYVDMNEAFCSLLGYTREELIGRDVLSVGLIPEEERAQLYEVLRQGDGMLLNAELRVRVRDGSFRYIVTSSAEISLNGVPHRLNTGLDVTERRQAEERLRQLNRTYAVLSDVNQLIVREREPRAILEQACRIAVDKGGFLLAWIGMRDHADSPLKLTEVAGATPDTMAVVERVLSDPQLGCAFTLRALDTGEHSVCNDIENDPLTVSWRDPALQRGYRAMASFALTVNDVRTGAFNLYADRVDFFDADEIRLLDELARDIGFALEVRERERERQRAIEELQASEERFRELAETIQDVFWVTDPSKQRVHYVSPAYETLWQRSCQSLYDNPRAWMSHVHPEDRERVAFAFDSQACGSAYDEEYRIIRADGAVRWVHAQAFPVLNAAGTVNRIVGVVQDITERHTLQQQLAQSQKMQAMGTLAGGIAHDFNNLLAAIIGNADLARLDLQEDHPALTSIGEIIRAGQRAKEVVQRILTFSRPQEHHLKLIQLQPVVSEAVGLLRSTIPAGVQLHVESAAGLPAVCADASQIHQVVLNLVTNAWHAMEGAPGRIDIRLEACRIDSSFSQVHPELQPGPHVRLSVRDTGKGMDGATLARIFEPFYSTKTSSQGTGLGLSVVHGIVRSHDGAIVVESEPQRGAVFHIYLPANEEDAGAQTAEPAAMKEGRSHGERILYLDDEEPLVYLAVRFLEKLGYRVEGYIRAEDALKAFRDSPHAFDLIITDYNMPGISGMEVARQMMQIRSDALVVLASGYLRPSEIDQARALGIREIVLKPNTIAELGPLVQRLLTGRDV